MVDLRNKILKNNYKIIIIASFLGVLLLLTYFFIFILNTTVIISHFYYIPVILSCYWWKKRGLIIAFLLGGLLLFSPIFQGSDILTLTSIDNIIRTLFLIIVGIVVAILSIRSSKSQSELQGRVNELNCLYGITKVISNPNSSVDEILVGVLNGIKSAIQQPNLSCIKIHFRGKEYKSENFKTTDWKITKEVKIQNYKLNLEICYLQEAPFSKAELKLLEKILQELKATLEFKIAWIT